MKTTFHHTHLFASNIDESLLFYREMLGAKIILDREMAGARNVLISIGSGKINLYGQPPRSQDRGVVHHLGIETDDLGALVEHMKQKGYDFKKTIRDYGAWKYIMAEGPDNILLELFEIVEGDSLPNGFSSL
ncbi:MAG: VOC family protein [Desulfobacteraceae bacterium]|nr:VOC family protein [Desulfobacteraceae bacterium]